MFEITYKSIIRFYERIEKYVSERSGASFSHTICPECGKKLYPDYYPENGHP